MKSRKPTIAVFVHSHPFFSKGGAEIAAFNSFRAFLEEGYDARLFCGISQQKEVPERVFREDETLREYARSEYIFPVREFDDFELNQKSLTPFLSLRRKLHERPPDVFHFHHFYNVGQNLVSLIRAEFPNAKFAFTLHELMAICYRDGQMVRTEMNDLCSEPSDHDCHRCFPEIGEEKFRSRRESMRSFLESFDLLLSPSEFVAQRFLDWGLRNDIYVLENGYRPVSEERSLPADEASLTRRFAFFGQPTRYKGLDLFVEAASRSMDSSPEFSFAVYGCTRETFLRMFGPRWVPVLARAGGRLRFEGVYQPAQAIELMRDNGWIVLPSIWWENSPVVIQEAFLAGRPPIVADLGGMREKVAHGVDGLHFEARNAVSLTDRMIQAGGNQELWNRLRRGRQTPPSAHETNRELLALIFGAEGTPSPGSGGSGHSAAKNSSAADLPNSARNELHSPFVDPAKKLRVPLSCSSFGDPA